jgi:hypothetical protein
MTPIFLMTNLEMSGSRLNLIWVAQLRKMKKREKNDYRKTPLSVPGVHTFSKANFGWIKLPVTKNRLLN